MMHKEQLERLQAGLRSPKTRRYGLRILATFVLFSVIGFFALPPLVKSLMLDQLSQVLHRPVTVERVSINPYTLTLEVNGVRVQEPGGEQTFASFDRLFVNLQSSSLFRGGVVLREVRLENPKIRIARLPDRRYNVSDLIDEFLAKPKTDDPTPAFSLNNIQLTGGAVEFDDQLMHEKHVVDGITLTLPFISSMAYATESFVEPLFAANVNGAPLSIKGRSKPFAKSLESEVALDLAGVKIAQYFDYVPASLGIPLPIRLAAGELDTRLTLKFHQEENQSSSLMLSGSATVRNLLVNESSGAPLLAFKQLQLDLGSADLFKQRFAIDHLRIDSPEIHARVDADGNINWLAVFAKGGVSAPSATPAPERTPAAGQLAWSLADAQISGGKVQWQDESNGSPFTASLDSIDIGLKQLDSKGDRPATFELSAGLQAGEAMSVNSFKLAGGQLDLAKREISIADVQVHGVNGRLQRAADGAVNWIKPPKLALAPASAPKPAPNDSPTPSAGVPGWQFAVARISGDEIGLKFEDKAVSPAATHVVDGLSLNIENLSSAPGQSATVATHFKFNRKGEIGVEGSVLPSPLKADLKVDVKTLELLPLQPYFSEKLNIAITRGHVTVKGALQLRSGEAKATAGDKSDAAGLSGGFTGEATIGDFSAVDKLNSADFLSWKSFYVGKVDARINPNNVSIGDVALSDFFARVIVNPEGKLNLLQIVRQDESVPTEIVPATDGKTDGKKETTENPAPAPAAQGAKPPGQAATPVATDSKAQPSMPFKVDKITLQGGTVRFTDNFVKPNYTANLKSIGGRLTGLSSEPGSVASLELRGSYDDVAPLNLTAKINPLSAKPYLDLQADVKGVELTPFSSYSGKYAGYAIEKGKLSLFVKYKIENDELKAENRVFLDQLTFGDAVDTPSATKLPVRLAVSLLKNRNGEIDLELPISGSLSDPQFSVGGLVVKVIVNLLVKAVTSPFALLGSMFEGGEQMSTVEFDYGQASIAPEAQKRLEALAKALVERPQLKLEIEAHVDAEQDREGLKTAGIKNKVRALKRADLTKNGVESASDAAVTVSDEEYPDLLERVYRAEKFPKPRNTIGMVKSLPVAEMEKLMLANTTVDEDDLRSLGDERAKGVRDWLVEHQVAVERVFLLPTKLAETETKPAADAKPAADSKLKRSRIDFSLK